MSAAQNGLNARLVRIIGDARVCGLTVGSCQEILEEHRLGDEYIASNIAAAIENLRRNKHVCFDRLSGDLKRYFLTDSGLEWYEALQSTSV